MEFVKQVARNYWLVYYAVYVGGVAAGLGRYWQRLAAEDGIFWLAAIFGASAGSALLVAILLEVLGRMVLLIPAAIKKYKEAGRRSVITTLARRGGRADGSIQVNLTREEVNALLKESEEEPG